MPDILRWLRPMTLRPASDHDLRFSESRLADIYSAALIRKLAMSGDEYHPTRGAPRNGTKRTHQSTLSLAMMSHKLLEDGELEEAERRIKLARRAYALEYLVMAEEVVKSLEQELGEAKSAHAALHPEQDMPPTTRSKLASRIRKDSFSDMPRLSSGVGSANRALSPADLLFRDGESAAGHQHGGFSGLGISQPSDSNEGGSGAVFCFPTQPMKAMPQQQMEHDRREFKHSANCPRFKSVGANDMQSQKDEIDSSSSEGALTFVSGRNRSLQSRLGLPTAPLNEPS